jgi:prepilin-type N-terminal cleavage/methylation domain-containing protein
MMDEIRISHKVLCITMTSLNLSSEATDSKGMDMEIERDDRGFTLIELLIVIVILGILATVVVLSVGGIRDQTDQQTCAGEARSLATAIEAYYTRAGSYPSAGWDPTAGSYALMRDDPEYFAVGGAGALVGAGDNSPVGTICDAI